MPIAASDLKAYGAANHAEDDSSTQGGAIDLTTKVELTPMAANDTLDVLSSSGSDTTQTVTITGRSPAGAIVSEVYNINGTTPDTGATTFERVLKVVMSATAVGTITVRRSSSGPTVCTLEPGVTKVRRLGYNSSSNPSATRSIYEKVFLKNTHGTLTLTSAKVKMTTEPSAASDTLFAVEDAVNDTGTSTNRLTAPSGVGTFQQLNVEEPVPGNALAAGSQIGAWIRVDLAAGNAAFKDDITLQLLGNTT